MLPQLGWVITRFRDAGQPGWTTPGPEEMQQHFSPDVLAARPAPELIAAIASAAPALREELTVVAQTPLTAQVRIGGLEVFASAAADPPHRLTGLLAVPLGRQITDPRVAAPPAAQRTGDVPATVEQIADESFAELGLPGLTLAGGGPGRRRGSSPRAGPTWTGARSWPRGTAGRRTAAPHSSPRPPSSGWWPTAGSPSTPRPTTSSAACGSKTPPSRSAELLTHTAGVDSPGAVRAAG